MYSGGTWRAHSFDFQDESSAGESQKRYKSITRYNNKPEMLGVSSSIKEHRLNLVVLFPCKLMLAQPQSSSFKRTSFL